VGVFFYTIEVSARPTSDVWHRRVTTGSVTVDTAKAAAAVPLPPSPLSLMLVQRGADGELYVAVLSPVASFVRAFSVLAPSLAVADRPVRRLETTTAFPPPDIALIPQLLSDHALETLQVGGFECGGVKGIFLI
jgi:hypothetical protein